MSTSQSAWMSLQVRRYPSGRYALSILRNTWEPHKGTRSEQLHSYESTERDVQMRVWEAVRWLIVFDRIERLGSEGPPPEHQELEQPSLPGCELTEG